jgi:hypothetical protein
VLFKPDEEAGHFRYPYYYPADEKRATPEVELSLHAGIRGRAFQTNELVMIDDIEGNAHSNSPRAFYVSANRNHRKAQYCVSLGMIPKAI